VQDSLGLFALANVTVLINNRNEPPVFNNVFGPQPGSSLTSFSRSLFENSAIGFTLGAPLLITDPEEAIGAGLLVDITAGNSLNVFSINSTGHLLVSNTLNLVYETTQSFTLTVRVRDSGKPETAQAALEKTTSVNIAVLPINFPPTISGDTFTIAENSASGSTVMKGAVQAQQQRPLQIAILSPLPFTLAQIHTRSYLKRARLQVAQDLAVSHPLPLIQLQV
jgi:hypothetical protein